MIFLGSKSSNFESFSHLLKKFRLTDSSAEKIATGIALSVTGALFGCSEMIYLTARPLSFTISEPRNSPNLLAVVIDVDFWPPYSSKALLIDLFSQIKSIRSSSSKFLPLVSKTSNQRLATLATAA
ncbi:hypothetical protein WICMUC_001820 [Wickerhamomyces mucosus]|uniref:Uncharacterized protein n=1 Tax=Wickerhamomyces mucosus TaxID=1378264 RepID=A0A9P8TFU5_9ASCO|nr:hypothetical protein WICMUC_001820 [Wickerhamomyces mucosus]